MFIDTYVDYIKRLALRDCTVSSAIYSTAPSM